MSLSKLLPIPRDEFFQNIRWKFFYHRKPGTFVTVITSFGVSEIELSTEEVKEEHYVSSVQSMKVKRGRLYIDESRQMIFCPSAKTMEEAFDVNSKDFYETGFHAFIETNYWLSLASACGWDKLPTPLPVLLSDVVAYGEQYDIPVVVARMMYVLTAEEYDFLESEHRPIRIEEDLVEVEL